MIYIRLIKVLLSLGGFLDRLHEGSLESDELIAQGHHVREVASCPSLDLFLEVLQSGFALSRRTSIPQCLTEGSNLYLKVGYLRDVT